MEVLATLLRRLRRGAEPGVLRHFFFCFSAVYWYHATRLGPPGGRRAASRMLFVQTQARACERRAGDSATARGGGRFFEFRRFFARLPLSLRVAPGRLKVFFALHKSAQGQRANRVLNARIIDPRLRSVLSEVFVGLIPTRDENPHPVRESKPANARLPEDAEEATPIGQGLLS